MCVCVCVCVCVGVCSTDCASTERDTNRSELDICDAGNEHVAQWRLPRWVIRRRTASDGRRRLAHGRKQHRRQRRQYIQHFLLSVVSRRFTRDYVSVPLYRVAQKSRPLYQNP